MRPLDGKAAWVTGAGSGIGAPSAARLGLLERTWERSPTSITAVGGMARFDLFMRDKFAIRLQMSCGLTQMLPCVRSHD